MKFLKTTLFLTFLFLFILQKISFAIGFEGIGYTGENPPDSYVAVGPQYIINIVNKTMAIYSKDGNLIEMNTLNDWFYSVNPPESIYDPKVIYDQYDQHWVILSLSRDENTSQSFYLLSASETSDPTGNWYFYKLDASTRENYSDKTFADFPDIGYNDDAVFITSDQYSFDEDNQDDILYSRIRIIKKSELYSGQSLTYRDFNDISDENGSLSHTLRAAKISVVFLTSTLSIKANWIKKIII